jgi:hypothetical protein
VSEDLDREVGAASLLGAIGGMLSRRTEVLDVLPVVSEHGHEIIALDVETVHGTFRLTAEPRD